MPIYEYVCDDCGTRYERIVRHPDSEVTCPKCCSGKQTIQLSVFAARTAGGSDRSGGSSPASEGGRCCQGGCGCR